VVMEVLGQGAAVTRYGFKSVFAWFGHLHGMSVEAKNTQSFDSKGVPKPCKPPYPKGFGLHLD
jgi:hypothetical protein